MRVALSIMGDMMSTFAGVATTLMRIPTAPYKEHWLRGQLEEMLSSIPGVVHRRDRWGNVHARLSRKAGAGPVVFVAHMDHPGFVVHSVDGHRVEASFEGGVDDSFFTGGAVRLFRSVDDDGLKAKIVEFSPRDPDSHSRRIVLETRVDASDAILGMWDLPACSIDADGILRARGIDDIGGVSAIVAALQLASGRDEAVDFRAMFTRAEEPGYRGALLFCGLRPTSRHSLVPPDSWVISVETSSARPTTPIGGGAILRVGDKSSIFDPGITRAIQEVAEDLTRLRGVPPLRRALMDGGTCEATVFNHYGYASGGLCVPLGNYHNMNRETGRIDSEFISIADADALVRAMAELALAGRNGTRAGSTLARELRTLTKDAKPKMSGWPPEAPPLE